MQPDESRRHTAIPWTAYGQLDVLVFDLGGQSFALEAVLVREFLDMMPEPTVPGAPPLVAPPAGAGAPVHGCQRHFWEPRCHVQ